MSRPSPPSSPDPSPTPPNPVLAPGTPPTLPHPLSPPSPSHPPPAPGTPGTSPPPSPSPGPQPPTTTTTAATTAPTTTTAAAATTTTSPLFARLPPELRSHIYQLAFIATARRKIHTLPTHRLRRGHPRRRAAARTEAVVPRLYHVDGRGPPAASAPCGGDVVWWLTQSALLAPENQGRVAWEGEAASGERPATPAPRVPGLARVMVAAANFRLLMQIWPPADFVATDLPFARWPNLHRLVVGFFYDGVRHYEALMNWPPYGTVMIEGPYDELVEEVEVVPASARETVASYGDEGDWEDTIEHSEELDVIGLDRIMLTEAETSALKKSIQQTVMENRHEICMLGGMGIEVVWAVIRETASSIPRSN